MSSDPYNSIKCFQNVNFNKSIILDIDYTLLFLRWNVLKKYQLILILKENVQMK